MDGHPKRQWGVTAPISEAPPTETDLRLNDQLIDELKRQNNFETPEGTERRAKVLKHLQKVTEEFVRRVGKAKNLAPSVIENGGGKIFTFGSYALGAFGPGSDIDTLTVAPKYVDHEEFFKYFPDTLRDLSPATEINKCESVPHAFVPIIKLIYSNVEIDLLFVSIPSLSTISPDLKLAGDKTMIRGLSDSQMRSVNGTRVTQELLDLVPQVKTFRHALRVVKLWANQRAIYGNVFGYPGGVAWAIMVARICQLYPMACSATVLSKFFNLMMKWSWPRPIMLKAIEESNTMGLKVWNPQIYPGDRAHMMPIITPAFPSMCATHTIMRSTKRIMLEEFQRADKILNEIATGKKAWKDLFERHSFFTEDHKHYLSVVAAARTKEAFDTWMGSVRAKFRLLVKGIDESDAGVAVARPFIEGFKRTHLCKTEDEIDRVCQGNVEYVMKEEEPATNGTTDKPSANGEDGSHTIYTCTFYVGITLDSDAGKQLDISYPSSEFKRIVTSLPEYDSDIMSVRVVYKRSHELPDDVFEDGDVRPSKPVKSKKSKGSKQKASKTETAERTATPEIQGAKRKVAQAGLDDVANASTKRRQSENGVATVA